MRYGLIGEKLGHSWSKVIHESFGIYTYELKELAPAELAGFLSAREFAGINVTIPYKKTVMPMLDEIAEDAASVGAVNTVPHSRWLPARRTRLALGQAVCCC